jgi:hypothetical protein
VIDEIELCILEWIIEIDILESDVLEILFEMNETQTCDSDCLIHIGWIYLNVQELFEVILEIKKYVLVELFEIKWFLIAVLAVETAAAGSE